MVFLKFFSMQPNLKVCWETSYPSIFKLFRKDVIYIQLSQAVQQQQHCCNDDQQSQWEDGNFDPL